MQKSFQLNAPQKQESGTLYFHEPNFLFINKSGKRANPYRSAMKILYELEETPKSFDAEWLLAYTKKLASYVSNLASKILGFTQYAEALSQLLAYDLERLWIWT